MFVFEVQIFFYMFIIDMQDGVQFVVVVKICKEDNEDFMMEKFLEEVCMYFIISFIDSIKYLVDSFFFYVFIIILWYS